MTVSASPPVRADAGLRGFVPGLALVGSYKRDWLVKDLVAGLVLSALLVPQGMAYAELAGLPPVTGLYTSILCLLGYAVFGPSRILVLGPDSSLGPMIAATILPLVMADGDPAVAVAYASVLALLVGLVMTGRRPRPLRLRRRPALQAHPDRVHERARPDHRRRSAAEALRVLGGRRRPHRRGARVPVRAGGRRGQHDRRGHRRSRRSSASSSSSGCCPRCPSVLVVVVLAALAVNLLDLQEAGVDTIGVLPQGFPPLTLPTVPVGRPRRPVPRSGGHRRRRPRGHDVDRLLVRRPAGGAGARATRR